MMIPRKPKRKQLRIHLFGPFTVECDRVPLAMRRRKVRALLCYLAASPKQVPRECLCGLLWPDYPEAQARRNLTHLLTHLQHALPTGAWLISEGDTLCLSSARVWVDTRAFAQCLSVRSLLNEGRMGERRAASASERLDPETQNPLENAVALYRGEFLAGFSLPTSPEFDVWVSTEREHWRHEYLRALARLVRGYAAMADTTRAIDCAQRYLAMDELSEEMHCRLMELYAAAGNRLAALRQYETCVAALERELGVDPLPETQATYQATLQGATPIRIQPPVALPQIPSLQARLIGRADVFALLDTAWNDVVAGHGRVVFLTGEAGIGKTRLAQEFAASIALPMDRKSEGRAARAVAGSAQASESKTPYFPLLTALRAYLSSVDWQTLSSRLGALWLTECARVLPEICAYWVDLRPMPALEPRYSRTQLFEALTRLVLAFSADGPLLLFLDDMQWADNTTMAWLETFARRMATERVLLLLAYRGDIANQDLVTLREAVNRIGMSLTVPLNRLSVQEVTELIRQLSGQTDGAVLFSQRLHKETDGNPFFLLEILRTLFDHAVVRRAGDRWQTDWDEITSDYRELPLPESVRVLLASRLRALSPAARQVAEVAAVIGPTFDHVLVWRASGRSEEEVADALDELVARQFVRETQLLAPLQSAGERYAFTHDKLQEEAYHELSVARRRLLHRRVGEALSSLNPNAVTALARHFEQAQDWKRAAIFALRAGQAARGVFAHSEAHTHFERTLLLLQFAEKNLRNRKEHAANQRMRLEAMEGRGWVLRLLGEMDAYARDLEEVVRLARELGDRKLQARACWRQAYAALWFCRYDQVARAADEGIALSRAVGDIETEMECVWTLALAARATGDYPSARLGLECARKYFAAQENLVAQVHLLSHLSTLNLLEKSYPEAERTARQALALCDQGHLPYHRRLPMGDLGAVAAKSGDAERARANLSESLTIARQIADRTQEIFCLGHMGRLSLLLKNTTEARERFTAALQVAQSVGSRAEQSWLYAGLAEMHVLAGDFAQARDAAQRALAIAKELGQKRDQAVARELLTRL